MITVPLAYYSDGLKLEGMLHVPDDLAAGERRPAVIICSGFQGLKEWVPARWWPSFLARGFPVMAFDYRGFGTSEGARGRMFPEEEIRDVMASITCLQQQPHVDPDRIGLLGWGLGGGIVVAVTARDRRVHATACVNGLGNAGRTVRDAVPYPDWLALQNRLATDRVQRVLTGKSAALPAHEVTHPGRSRERADYRQFDQDLAEIGKQAIPAFTLESADAYYRFRPEEEVARISPRPLLIVHGDRNVFMPIDEALSLYARAQEPKELLIIPGAEHLEWIAPGSPLRQPYMERIVGWFAAQLGLTVPSRANGSPDAIGSPPAGADG